MPDSRLQALLERRAARRAAISTTSTAIARKLRHDLRTPINAVKGYGEMIVEDARDGGHDVDRAPICEKLLAPPTAC